MYIVVHSVKNKKNEILDIGEFSNITPEGRGIGMIS